MVDQWWKLTESNPAEALRMSDVVRRAEAEMYLSPAERARAGLTPQQPAAKPSSSSSARARLRSLDGGVAS